MTKKELRERVRMKYNGMCAYCGEPLPKRWHIDHLKPIVRDLKDSSKCEHPENENFDNLMPSCPSCNIMKSSLSLENFRQLIAGFVRSLNRDSTQYKFAKRYGLVKETNAEVKFYFELHESQEQLPEPPDQYRIHRGPVPIPVFLPIYKKE